MWCKMAGLTPWFMLLGVTILCPEATTTSSPCQFREHAIVHFNLHRSQSCVPAGAGPFPILRSGHQAATHRVGVNVINHGPQRFDARDVPVVAAAGLPEAVPQARPFAHRQAFATPFRG